MVERSKSECPVSGDPRVRSPEERCLPTFQLYFSQKKIKIPELLHLWEDKTLLWDINLAQTHPPPLRSLCGNCCVCRYSCLAPLRYCCDYRPYFTIHDSEFKEYTTRTQAP